MRFLPVLFATALAVLSSSGVEARPRAAVQPARAVPSVDVSRLKALGLGPTADLVGAAVAREIEGAGGNGRIVVRLTGLSMNAYAGSNGGSGAGGGGGGGTGNGGDFDYLEGDIQVLGPRGEVLSQRHQVASSPASSGGAWYLPGAETRRVDALGRAFGDWARRLAF